MKLPTSSYKKARIESSSKRPPGPISAIVETPMYLYIPPDNKKAALCFDGLRIHSVSILNIDIFLNERMHLGYLTHKFPFAVGASSVR